MGYFGGVGIITMESTIEEAPRASTILNQKLGFDLHAKKSERGIRVEFLGATVACVVIRNKCEAQLLSSQARIRKVPEKIKTILEQQGASLA